MNVRYRVELSQAERDELTALLSGGKHAARKLKRAQILLAADAGASDEEIATSVGVGGSTVYRTKRRFVEGNLEAALSEEPRPGASRKLSGKEEALLVATACSKPPEGRARWTLELLAGELVRLTEHDEPLARDGAPALGRKRPQALAQGHVVHSAGRRRIRRPHGGCARPLCRGARSEAAGGLLRREPDPAHRRGAPADPGRAGPARALRLRVPRNGTANLFVFLDAHRPWRKVKVTDAARGRRLRRNACASSSMSTYPEAERIRVVLDNLSTHSPGALYQAFPPAEARRILRRLEFHYTPKHASWLNMVEIEIGVLRGQCLDRRIGDQQRLVSRNRRLGTTAKRLPAPASNGCSPPTTPAPKWAAPIQEPRKSHNHCAAVLVQPTVRQPA